VHLLLWINSLPAASPMLVWPAGDCSSFSWLLYLAPRPPAVSRLAAAVVRQHCPAPAPDLLDSWHCWDLGGGSCGWSTPWASLCCCPSPTQVGAAAAINSLIGRLGIQQHTNGCHVFSTCSRLLFEAALKWARPYHNSSGTSLFFMWGVNCC